MNWLARLKKIDTDPERDATEPTKPGFVGFAAPVMALMQKIGADLPAANDAVRAETEDQKYLTNLNIFATAIGPMPNPDRWAWPNSQAMTGREIDTFTARLARFTDKGLSLIDGEALADKLVTRDRDSDDRRLCLECAHLAGRAAGSWGCKNWERAGLAGKSRDAQLSASLVCQLHRCGGCSSQYPD